MSRISFGVWAAMALILVPLAGAQSYAVTDLGTLPHGKQTIPNAINSHGDVTGNAWGGDGMSPHAFLWTGAKGIRDIGALPGDGQSYGLGINDSDAIVGISTSTKLGNRAFLWTQNGGMQDLGNLGGEGGTAATGINNAGEVVGYSLLSDNRTLHAFLWTQAGGMQDIGTLGGPYSSAFGINDAGEVVGQSALSGVPIVSRGFLWTRASGMKNLGALTKSNQSGGLAINKSGEVVGYSFVGNYTAAFAWTQNEGMWPVGGNRSSACGVNDGGDVVGSFGTPFSYAFIWTVVEHEQNLNDLIPANSGWLLIQACAINSSGQIAAEGLIGTETHGALLTPAK
jgi:probable HAF family extracellular repeat protein